MPNIKMTDTTALVEYGALRKGEVYSVTDEVAAHLVGQGLASKTSAKTTAEQAAEDAKDEEPEKKAPATTEKTAAPDPDAPAVRGPLNKPETQQHPERGR
jgi:hypothetical protein